MNAPATWPAANASAVRTSSTVASASETGAGAGEAARKGPRFSSTIRSMFGGRGVAVPTVAVDEFVDGRDREQRVSAPLGADRRARVGAHPGAAERAGDVAGVDGDVVGELEQAVQRVEEPLRALAGLDREIGPGDRADEERVAGQQGAVDEEAAVLGPVAGRVQAADALRADGDLVAVRERVVRDTRRSASACTDTGMPCSSASRPWPETWSA